MRVTQGLTKALGYLREHGLLASERKVRDRGEDRADISGPKKTDFRGTYERHVAAMHEVHSSDKALEQAIAGNFSAFGVLQRELLVQHGLQPAGYLIDVGCGSGRLTGALQQYFRGNYLGIDVIPELLEHARGLCTSKAASWTFSQAPGLQIPETSGVANMVCFFSVMTHLLHEESYVYLQEAKRVLKPGGTVVISFLEFSIPSHWAVFAENIRHVGDSHHLNQFMSRDLLRAWAQQLDLTIDAIYDGDKCQRRLKTDPLCS